MKIGDNLSVVIPFECSGANLPRLLDSLAPEEHPGIEFLLCRTPADSGLATGATADNVRWLECAPGSRIPDMWRDGIAAARGEFVALLTAHCVPAGNWLENVRRLDWPAGVAGVGGYFVNSPRAAALDWAIYLLRYLPFSRPAAALATDNIAADNAVYRRNEILSCRKLLPMGFWEPQYHREFSARGLRLALSPDLIVTHHNRYTAAQFAEQRREHGAQYGRDRASRLGGLGLASYVLAAPAIPLILFVKVVLRAWRYQWVRELRPAVCSWLVFLCANWAIGEFLGVLGEVRARTTT